MSNNVDELPRSRRRRRKLDIVPFADRARDARRWEAAARLYREALDRGPRNAHIWVQYGHALKESGERRDPDKLARAELAYRKALSLDPGVADSHLQLGHVLKLQGKTEEAQASYLRAFALGPSSPDPLHELRRLGWSDREVAELRIAAGSEAANPIESAVEFHARAENRTDHSPSGIASREILRSESEQP